ncbi:hypothetical protein DITRI_Ditri14bG0065200 [Diplodiscus trichospermus]
MIGGVKAHSLALMADAAHLARRFWVSAWKATPYQSFRFNRVQVLGALVPVQLIWFISASLIYEAVDRLVHKNEEVDGAFMCCHDRSHHHHQQQRSKTLNINLRGAYILVRADLIQSVGVVIAAAVIRIKPTWLIIDLLFTLVVSTVALSYTVPMLRDIYGILMERTPRGIDIDMLESGIKGIMGVQNIHDLYGL